MDAKTLARLRREQLRHLKCLLVAKEPPGVRHDDVEVLRFARTKYLDEIMDTLRVWFPRFLDASAIGYRELARLFTGGSLQLDLIERVDDMFVRLKRYAREVYASDAWIELLTLERAIVKARLSPPACHTERQLAEKLKSARLARRSFADVDGLFFVRVRTNLAFDYLHRHPRAARRLTSGNGVVLVRRREGKKAPEILFIP